ncbi:hypothetical protein [Clostridium sp. Marseille-Q2269]|uniref:hypothetical protein n=1 Tax=Clostridium sp. Marseille-Q2269 TaxID=2942205 RepID=UPI0020731DA9|nr:hypothetical protein [Clostridium sp. Marseille-Q2269]
MKKVTKPLIVILVIIFILSFKLITHKYKRASFPDNTQTISLYKTNTNHYFSKNTCIIQITEPNTIHEILKIMNAATFTLSSRDPHNPNCNILIKYPAGEFGLQYYIDKKNQTSFFSYIGHDGKYYLINKKDTKKLMSLFGL